MHISWTNFVSRYRKDKLLFVLFLVQNLSCYFLLSSNEITKIDRILRKPFSLKEIFAAGNVRGSLLETASIDSGKTKYDNKVIGEILD